MTSSSTKVLRVFLAAAGVVVGSVVLVYFVGLTALESNRTVARQRGILRELTDFLATLADAETGQRGFLLTNDERYLGPYRAALADIETEKAALRARAAAGYLPAPAVDAIFDLSDSKLAELERTVHLRRRGAVAEALTILRAGEGKSIMDGIRAAVARLTAEEERELIEARERANAAITTHSIAFALIAALNLAFLAWAYRRIVREIHARETARQEADRQKDLLAATLASIGDGVIVTDATGRVTFLNHEAQRLTGWKDADARGQPLPAVFRIVDETSRQPSENPVEKVIRLGTVVGLANHTVLIARDGTETPIDDSAAPIRSGAGGPLSGVILVFRDFSEHKRAEHMLTRHVRMLDAGFDAIIVRDAQDRITSWNRGAAALYGWSVEEAAGQVTHALFRTEFPKPLPEILDDLQRDHRWEGELVHRRKDGSRITVFSRWVLENDEQGRPVGILETNMDITERKRIEEASRENEARFAGVIDSAMDAIIAVDAAQKIVLFNPAAEAMFGCPIGEAVGAPLDRFIPERSRAAHRRHVENFGATGTTNRRMGSLGALSGVRANGEEFPIEASISHLEVDGRKLFTVILRDVTERKRAETSLREARDELVRVNTGLDRAVQERTARLEEMVRELQHVSYAIAHDMRAPLRAMGAFAEILVEEAAVHGTTPTARDYCRRIATAASRLDILIRDALNYSRTVLQQPALEPVDLAPLVRGLLDTYPNFHADKAEIAIDGRLPVVLGNESLLTQCFSNLLGNAVKFVAHGTRPRVRVRVSEPAPGVTRVWIEDNGIGIPEHALPRLFGMFQKIDNRYEGTGIGLAIVRKVVERMDGKVGVESQPDVGSRFWVELRLAPNPGVN